MSGDGHRTLWSYRIVFSALVAGLMSVLIGGAIAVFQSDGNDTFSNWAETAPLAFAVAFPTSLIVVPMVQSVLDKIFEDKTGEKL